MFVSREADYALRILRVLVDGNIHSVKEISASQILPQPFAYKIIKKLALGDIVSIIRGPSGGCQLKADLSLVSLLDLLKILGEDAEFIACGREDYICELRKSKGFCNVHNKLIEIENKLSKELKSYNLLEILT